MAAICAVRFDPDLKQKYEQKVGEGKPKMSVLNIIRAKLIHRIFAVVKRQTVYERRLFHNCFGTSSRITIGLRCVAILLSSGSLINNHFNVRIVRPYLLCAGSFLVVPSLLIR